MSNLSPLSSLLPGLSVIVITLNEASNIEACLASVAFADQIVVVDGGSTDTTVALAKAKGAQVMVVKDWLGFGPQKNLALRQAKHKWVLALDADERISEALGQEIRHYMSRDEPVVLALPRLTSFCGQWIKHCGWTPDYVDRVWPQGHGHFSDDQVHERLVTHDLRRIRLKNKVLHYSYPTPAHYWDKLSRYSQAWALQRYTQGQTTSIVRAALSGWVAFMRSYFVRLGFLDGAMGFAVCVMQAQAAFGKYFTLYCLHRQGSALRSDHAL